MTLAVLAFWEVCARIGIFGSTVPPFSTSLDHIVTHWGDYQSHVVSTLSMAAIGLVLSSLLGVLAASLFAASQLAEQAFRGLLVVAYCAPPIVLLPVLISAFPTDVTRLIVITSMIVYPMTVSVLVGLQAVDQRAIDVIRVSGGGAFQVLWRLRLPRALPNFLSGLQVAIPTSILGAMLAELAGGRWGLGLYLISGIKSGDRPLVWGVTLLATAISAAGYFACGALARRVGAGRVRVDAAESSVFARLREQSAAGSGRLSRVGRAALTGGLGLFVPLAAWWLVVRLLDLNPIVMKDPFGVWEQLVTGPRAKINRDEILGALGSTLSDTAMGFAAGLGAAFLLAIVFETHPRWKSVLLPAALVTQTIPLVALVPLLLVTVGRGDITMLLIGISITFFPGFVLISQGLGEAPRPLVDLVHAAGGSAFAVLWKVKVPHAIPYLTAAARLLAPRALLGIILAEYVATGTGLGFVVYRARGNLDFGMMWSAAVVAVIVSCLVFWVAGYLERLVFRKFAGGGQ